MMNGFAFPVDDTTLLLLDSACRINPDTGHTELMTFLDMGTIEKTRTLVSEDGGWGGVPIYEVEYETGHEPFSPHDVILALVAEVQRLRVHVDSMFRLPPDVQQNGDSAT